jgi:imidazolonepropionase-like amidohydrolase
VRHCEDAYEQATREGYAENPTVIAAVSALKSAWKALHVANYNLMMAKGFFPVEIATLRADRVTRKACINLHAAIVHAAAENRLYNRCLMLTNPDQGSGKRREGTRAVA